MSTQLSEQFYFGAGSLAAAGAVPGFTRIRQTPGRLTVTGQAEPGRVVLMIVFMATSFLGQFIIVY
jgi:hypothetical protein